MYVWGPLLLRGIAGREHLCLLDRKKRILNRPSCRLGLWPDLHNADASLYCTSSRRLSNYRQCNLHPYRLGTLRPPLGLTFPSIKGQTSYASIFPYKVSLAYPACNPKIFPTRDAPGKPVIAGHFWGWADRDEISWVVWLAKLMILVWILSSRGAAAGLIIAGHRHRYTL